MMRHVALFLVGFAGFLFGATYQEPSGKFHFEYDDALWETGGAAAATGAEVDKKMSENTLATLQKKIADEKYRARFSVVVDDASKLKSNPEAKNSLLAAYQKHAVDFMKSQRFDVLSVTPTTVSGHAGFEVVANQRDFGLMFRQVVFLKGDSAYLLTATSRTEKYEEYLPQMKKFFDSFSLSTKG